MRIAPVILLAALTAKAAALPLYIGPAAAENSARSSPLLAALDWLEATPLGNATAAVTIFVTALAIFTLLTGSINWRLVATLALGCVILLGSAAMMAGLQPASAR